MKIYRTGATSSEWTLTDKKNSREVAKAWAASGQIAFDGTKDKSGTRHTDLTVELDAKDIVALVATLVRRYKQENAQLKGRLKKAAASIKYLEKREWQARASANDAIERLRQARKKSN